MLSHIIVVRSQMLDRACLLKTSVVMEDVWKSVPDFSCRTGWNGHSTPPAQVEVAPPHKLSVSCVPLPTESIIKYMYTVSMYTVTYVYSETCIQ